MKADNLSRRLAKLEDDPEQDMVTVTHQWLNEDGTPAGETISFRYDGLSFMIWSS